MNHRDSLRGHGRKEVSPAAPSSLLRTIIHGNMVLVAFKVEAELAELLSRLPNKSEFIRKGIAAQLGMACPLCHGKGMVHLDLFKQFAPLINRNASALVSAAETTCCCRTIQAN